MEVLAVDHRFMATQFRSFGAEGLVAEVLRDVEKYLLLNGTNCYNFGVQHVCWCSARAESETSLVTVLSPCSSSGPNHVLAANSLVSFCISAISVGSYGRDAASLNFFEGCGCCDR
jgi:hypothetical protein